MSGYDDLARGIRGIQEFGPDDPRVHQALQAAIDSGDLDDENTAAAYLEHGRCWHDTGKQTKARDALAQAISLSNAPALLALAHHELGETYFVLEQESEAEDHFRKSLAYDRQHLFAPDSLILLGRVAYMRTEHEDNLALVEECYGYFDEALALLEGPDGEKYGTFFGHHKALFDACFGKALCKSDMPRDKERFEAVPNFERAEQIALEHPEHITREELENIYRCWANMLGRMGLERDMKLVVDRAGRHLG